MNTQALDSRMARLEGTYEQIDKRLATVEGRLEGLEYKVDAGFNRLDAKIDARFDSLNGKIDRVVWVVVVGLLITILVNLTI